jgi:hypothetical protein
MLPVYVHTACYTTRLSPLPSDPHGLSVPLWQLRTLPPDRCEYPYRCWEIVSTRSATGNQSAEPSSANQTEGIDIDNPQGVGELIPFETFADEMEETME